MVCGCRSEILIRQPVEIEQKNTPSQGIAAPLTTEQGSGWRGSEQSDAGGIHAVFAELYRTGNAAEKRGTGNTKLCRGEQQVREPACTHHRHARRFQHKTLGRVA